MCGCGKRRQADQLNPVITIEQAQELISQTQPATLVASAASADSSE